MTAAAQVQQSVMHPARGFDSAIRNRELVQDRIGIDEVESVTDGQVLGQSAALAVQSRERRLFTIEVRDVGREFALLQHVRVAGEVCDPWPRFFGPRLMAVEVLAEDQ